MTSPSLDQTFGRLLDALRRLWIGGPGDRQDLDMAVAMLQRLGESDAASHDSVERIRWCIATLLRLPRPQAERRKSIEQVANGIKALQPLFGIAPGHEMGSMNSMQGEKRAGRPKPARKPATTAPLRPLPPDAPAESLPKVGEAVEKLLHQVIYGQVDSWHGVTIEDVLRIAPRRYVDYSNLTKIGTPFGLEGEVTVGGEIIDIQEIHSGGRPRVQARLSDGTGSLGLTWFNTWIAKQLTTGDLIYASGTIRRAYSGGLEIVTPEWERQGSRTLTTGRIAPVYPLTKGLGQKQMRSITRNALDTTRTQLVDWIADARPFIHGEIDLPPLDQTYERLHYPDDMDQVFAARRRLHFENQLLLQIGMVKRKREAHAGIAHPLTIPDDRLDRFVTSLPFTLTAAQRNAIATLRRDLGKDTPMVRLLQGDVGSGKTAVAAAASLVARASGRQTAFMAPTELLAEQHAASLDRLFGGLPGDERPRIALLTGSTKAKNRREIAAGLASGEIDLLVGTHALVQDAVAFHDLALAIVDEQHRFGVRQRALLTAKANGVQPHLLSMTATPIPRTLNIVLSGDLDVSTLNEMPPGRIPIVTELFDPKRRQDAYRKVREEVAKGHQAFVVCPLVEESEAIDARAAVEEAKHLQEVVFPNLKIDVVHGRMSSKKKDAVMTAFRDRQFDILVSTSVIEVGIDIPNATVMMIEGADRFGLAQLHQFRGRVGRGQTQSWCLLLADEISADGRARLETMVATNDGFVLAEKDLELRGPGDFIGTRQSGLPELGWMNQGFDLRLIEIAHAVAERIVDADPTIDIGRFPRLKPRLQQFWATATPLDATPA